MKTPLLLLLPALLLSICGISQCAEEYAGFYGKRSCSQADIPSSYNTLTLIEVVDSSRVLMTNFEFADNWPICNVEDTIFIDLDCTGMTLDCEYVEYELCVGVNGGLSYDGFGTLYTDSLRIPFTQCNPDGTQEICRVYKRDAYVGVEEAGGAHTAGLYPNPSNGVVQLDIVEEKEVNVYDVRGQLVLVVRSQSGSIDLTGLATGEYYVKFINTKGQLSMGRVFKE